MSDENRNLTNEDVQALADALNAPRPTANDKANAHIQSQRGQTFAAQKTARLTQRLRDSLTSKPRERPTEPEMRIDEEAEARSPVLREARKRAESARARRDAEEASGAADKALAEIKAERESYEADKIRFQRERDNAR